MKPSWLSTAFSALLLTSTASAQQALPLLVTEQLQQLTEQHQQTQLKIQQQRLDNELAQLQLEYSKVRLQQHQNHAVLNVKTPAPAADPLGQLVSEVRFDDMRLSLFRHQQQWRWQRLSGLSEQE